MRILLSPAKKLNTTAGNGTRTPTFLNQATTLAERAATLSPDDLAKMMDISPALSSQAHAWFQNWTADGQHEAGALFDGDVHTHLGYPDMTDLKPKAQTQIRILSGLYGLLHPNDSINPYRLEMGRKLAITPTTNTLYAFWNTTIGEALNKETDTVVNLASTEYFKAVQGLKTKLITPVFMEDRGKGPKIVSVNAKRARGAMAKWLLAHGLEGYKDFTWNGYRWAGRVDMDLFLKS